MDSELPAKLRRWAAGRPGVHQATEVLIDSTWLTDDRFIAACVVMIDNDQTIAAIDWAATASFLARHVIEERPEASVLRRALTLAEQSWLHAPRTAPQTETPTVHHRCHVRAERTGWVLMIDGEDRLHLSTMDATWPRPGAQP